MKILYSTNPNAWQLGISLQKITNARWAKDEAWWLIFCLWSKELAFRLRKLPKENSTNSEEE